VFEAAARAEGGRDWRRVLALEERFAGYGVAPRDGALPNSAVASPAACISSLRLSGRSFPSSWYVAFAPCFRDFQNFQPFSKGFWTWDCAASVFPPCVA
jgi:hypothetical protein